MKSEAAFPLAVDLAHIARELETAGSCTGPDDITVTSPGPGAGADPVVSSQAGVTNSAVRLQA